MFNPSEISVAILAGGLGTRLEPILRGRQKVVAKVRGYPFLEYILNQLNKAGFKKIVLCTGFLSDQVKKTFGKRYKNLHLYYSEEQTPLGTAGSLRKALQLLNSENVLIMNGDSFCEVDFKKLWRFHLNKRAKASLVITSVSDTSHFGAVELGSDDRIIRFQEKKINDKGFINAGIYLINKALIEGIPKDKKISLEKEVFPNWVSKDFFGYKGKNFIDIGTPESYAQAELFFALYQL